MSLQALLREVDPDWFVPTNAANAAGETIPPQLLARARQSALGRRLLARCLIDAGMSRALTPASDGRVAAIAVRWPRSRLTPLLRDLGTLAFAPAIRAEIRREPVRRLKRTLGRNYLLPLDKAIWDGRVAPAVAERLARELDEAVAGDGDDAANVLALFDRQGRSELQAWASEREPVLAEWIELQHPRAHPAGPAHLPEKPLLFLLDHHDARARAA